MRSSSVSSIVQPQSVPSRVSVVLVEETEVRGAECLVSGLADEVVRWSAGATSLSSGTECMTGALRPGAAGTLSPYLYNPVGSLAHVGHFPHLTLTLLALLARMGRCPCLTPTLLALLARVVRCPRLTLTLLALLAHVGRCPRLTMNPLALLARVGCCPRLTLTMLALWARLGLCPHLVRYLMGRWDRLGRCPRLVMRTDYLCLLLRWMRCLLSCLQMIEDR